MLFLDTFDCVVLDLLLVGCFNSDMAAVVTCCILMDWCVVLFYALFCFVALVCVVLAVCWDFVFFGLLLR